MGAVIEFVIIIFCIAVACGLIVATVTQDNKNNNSDKKDKHDN